MFSCNFPVKPSWEKDFLNIQDDIGKIIDVVRRKSYSINGKSWTKFIFFNIRIANIEKKEKDRVCVRKKGSR